MRLKGLLFPPPWFILCLTAFCAAALPLVFIKGLESNPCGYGVFAIAFYWVCVLTAFLSRTLPAMLRRMKARLFAHPTGRRYMTDPSFRTKVSLHLSLCVNLLYVGVNLLSHFMYRSMWFVVFAVYYTILALMRFLLLGYARGRQLGDDRTGELRRAILCACILLLVNFALTGAVMMILYQNKGFQYPGMLIYAMAAYTFYITVHAALNLIKYHRYKSPVMSVSKIISLSAALVSMLALETAMLSEFGSEMASESKWLMIALTGAGVSAAVIGMALYVIIKSASEIKETKNNG